MKNKQEIEILPADNHKLTKLNWIVREYNGMEIFKAKNSKDNINSFKSIEDFNLNDTLNNLDDLQVGDIIAVPGLCGGYFAAEIKKDEYQKLFAESDSNLVVLDFDTDDRNCWIATTLINKKCIKMYQNTNIY